MALSVRSTVSTSRGFLGQRVVAPRNVARYSMRAGNWLPGSDAPSWLPDDMPGNYGFDPLGLAKDTNQLARYQEAELQNGRWAMLGAAGVIAVEALGYGNWADAPLWAVNGGKATYFGTEVPFDLNTLIAVEFVFFAIAEGARNENKDPVKRLYPGFDFLGLSKDPKAFEQYKLKEIKNGRLAMLACLGFFLQHEATGKSPLTNLADHIAAPWTANFATNGVSFPWSY